MFKNIKNLFKKENESQKKENKGKNNFEKVNKKIENLNKLKTYFFVGGKGLFYVIPIIIFLIIV